MTQNSAHLSKSCCVEIPCVLYIFRCLLFSCSGATALDADDDDDDTIPRLRPCMYCTCVVDVSAPCQIPRFRNRKQQACRTILVTKAVTKESPYGGMVCEQASIACMVLMKSHAMLALQNQKQKRKDYGIGIPPRLEGINSHSRRGLKLSRTSFFRLSSGYNLTLYYSNRTVS